MAEEIMNYASKANIRVDFYGETTGELGGTEKQLQATNTAFHSLHGFLTDEGLDLSLTNHFKSALDFNIIQQAKDLLAGVKAGFKAIRGNEQFGYIKGGLGGEIILNAPYYWQGTDPIELSVNINQIADDEKDILENYQRILEILSPNMGNTESGKTELAGGEVEGVQLAGSGPGLVYVHYFPQAGEGQGRMIFGPCLCNSVSMKIAPPYSTEYMPIVGIYSFKLQVSRIMDRSQITYLFNKKFPYSETGAATK